METLKPYLIIVTGRPGSGKTTFANELSDKLFMPLISRDRIKEGYVHTFGKKYSDLPPESNQQATEIFFNTLIGLIENNISVIAEAAFQHEVWSNMLKRFMEKSQIFLLICKVEDEFAFDRFIERGLNNELREYFHGDKGVDLKRKGHKLSVNTYDEPRLDFPTYHIDTHSEYKLSIQELGKIIFKNSNIFQNHRIKL